VASYSCPHKDIAAIIFADHRGDKGISSERKGQTVTTGRILGYIAVFLSGLLTPMTSVYADHFAAAGVESRITLETGVQFWFLGVSSRTSDDSERRPVIPTQFQCTVVHTGEAISFWLLAPAKEINPFMVETSDMGDIITMTGMLRSHIAFVSSRGIQLLEEETPFEAVGVDVALPGAGTDTFDLKLVYNAQGIGALLFEALGSDFVTCTADTCTLRLTGTVEKGEIEGHTAGGM
jgi:hypothetical protein